MRTSILCILGIMFVVPAFAEQVYFVDSRGVVELVDLSNPGAHRVTAPVDTTGKAGVSFQISYTDVDTHSGYGFDDATKGAARRACLVDVCTYLSGLLSGYNATVNVQVEASQHGTSGVPLAFFGTMFWLAAGWTNGFAFDHITTGVDPNPSSADIHGQVYFDFDWYTGSDPAGIGWSQFDLRTVMLHEITHGLGFLSLTNSNGQSTMTSNEYSRYEGFLENGNGLVLFSGNPPSFHGTAADLLGQNNGVRFNGAHAVAAFGSKPPIYAPSSWQDGSSISHWNYGISGNATMEPIINQGEILREYRPVDIGGLEDIGYTITLPNTDFTFTQEPVGGWFEAEKPLTMSVAFINAVGNVTYQWQKNGVDLTGATNSSLSFASLGVMDTGAYRCVVTDQSKAAHPSSVAWVRVFPIGSMPVAGGLGLAALISLCVWTGARRMRVK